MVQYYQLQGFVVAYDEETGDVGTYVEFHQEDNSREPSFVIFYNSKIDNRDCLQIGRSKIRQRSPFSSKAEFQNYYKNLPVWNKTKYYDIGKNYYSCLDSKEVDKEVVYS